MLRESSTTMSTIRQREEDADPSRSPKRTKIDAEDNVEQDVTMTDPESSTNPATDLSEVPPKEPDSLLPPSHVFLNAPPAVYTPDGSMQKIMETDVGISEYVGHDVPKIEGIIKQRSVCACLLCVLHSSTSQVHRFFGVRS